jgi:hypothetical protein
MAINELVFGQRVPKKMLIEKDRTKSLQERTMIPCPHCNTVHPGYKWSTTNNAYKNWFGLYCDHCGKTIPCLMNLTSFILLLITFPLWIWFVKKWKQSWLEQQPKRYNNLKTDDIADRLAGYGWIRQGLFMGFLFYIINIISRLISDDPLTLSVVLLGIPIHAIGGLIFGYIMKIINQPKKSISKEV